MSRQITGSLEYPAGTNFNGTIEARHIEGNTVTVPQSISEFTVTDSLYDFTLENGSYQFSIKGIISEGSTDESRVKIGLGIVNDGAPIDLLTLIGLSEPLSSPVEDLINERGLPSGGTTGQHLSKTTDNDYEVEWVDALDEAPIDGQQYARQDGDWTVVTGGGGGASTFVELTDTPTDYVGQAGKVVRVNTTPDALVFDDLTKSDVGLDQVDNTSDLNKPVSTATQAALDGKEDDLGLPTSDGQVLASTTAGVRSWVDMSGGGGSGVTYNSNFNIFYGAITDVDPAVNMVVEDQGRIARTAASSGAAYVHSKYLIPVETYWEVTHTVWDSGSIASMNFSPVVDGVVDWSSGIIVQPLNANININRITSGTRARNRSASVVGSFAPSLSAGDTVRYWITRDDANTVTIYAQKNGTGTIYSQAVTVTGVGDASNWTLSVVGSSLSSNPFDVTYNFGKSPFLYTPESGKSITALSPAILKDPFPLWSGSAIILAQTVMDFTVFSTGNYNPGTYIARTTPAGGDITDVPLQISSPDTDFYGIAFDSETATNVYEITNVQWDKSALSFRVETNKLNLPTAEVTQIVPSFTLMSYKFE